MDNKFTWPDPQPMETAPKDTPILAWCDHEAGLDEQDRYDDEQDRYNEERGNKSPHRLTLYLGHAEGIMHAPTGWHIIEWGGSWDDSNHEYQGGYMPDWWFVAGSEFEMAANPMCWYPLPENKKLKEPQV